MTNFEAEAPPGRKVSGAEAEESEDQLLSEDNDQAPDATFRGERSFDRMEFLELQQTVSSLAASFSSFLQEAKRPRYDADSASFSSSLPGLPLAQFPTVLPHAMTSRMAPSATMLQSIDSFSAIPESLSSRSAAQSNQISSSRIFTAPTNKTAQAVAQNPAQSGQFQFPSTTQYDNFNQCQSSLYTDDRFDDGFSEISSAEGDFVPSLLDSQPGCSNATVEQPSDEGAQSADIQITFEGDEETGPDTNQLLADYIKDCTTRKIKPDRLKEIMRQFPRPGNCSTLTVPLVNHPVWGELNRRLKTNDVKLQSCQTMLSKGLAALIQAQERLEKVEKQTTHAPSEINDIKARIKSSMALVGNAFYELSQRRKELLKPVLADRYQKLCSTTTPVTKFLFGDKIADSIKEINEAQLVSRSFCHNSARGSRNRYSWGNRPNWTSRNQSQSGYLNSRSPLHIPTGGGRGRSKMGSQRKQQ